MHRRTVLKSLPGLALATPAIAQPTRAATLRLVPESPLTSLDPTWTSATIATCHGYHVWDTLYAIDGRLQPQPQMAMGHQVSDDGRTWRIALREGLRFHDGTPVRGVDCIASLERWSKRDPFGQLLAKAVAEWRAPDDRTLEIRLVRPFPMLLEAIAHPDPFVAFIMPERIARTPADRAITEIVGSGPYRYLPDEFVSGARVAYARFNGYVPRDGGAEWASGGKVAHFSRVEWHSIPDASTAAAALQAGEVDWWQSPAADLVPLLARDRNIRLQVSNPTGLPAVMRLNTLQPPFDNAALRRAVLAATRQEDYMQAVYGDEREFWRTCPSLFPCGTPYGAASGGKSDGIPDDAAIRRAIAASGYAGQRIVILNPTDIATIAPLGQVTFDRLKRLGLNAELQEADWGTVVQRRASREPVERGGWSIFHTYGSGTAWKTPATSLVVRGQGSAGWFGWWDEPRVEELTQQWMDTLDLSAAAAIAAEIGRLALDGAATVPLGQIYARYAFRNSITGILQGTVPYPWNVRPV